MILCIAILGDTCNRYINSQKKEMFPCLIYILHHWTMVEKHIMSATDNCSRGVDCFRKRFQNSKIVKCLCKIWIFTNGMLSKDIIHTFMSQQNKIAFMMWYQDRRRS